MNPISFDMSEPLVAAEIPENDILVPVEFKECLNNNDIYQSTGFSIEIPSKKRGKKAKKQNEKEIMKNYFDELTMKSSESMKEVVNEEYILDDCAAYYIQSPNNEHEEPSDNDPKNHIDSSAITSLEESGRVDNDHGQAFLSYTEERPEGRSLEKGIKKGANNKTPTGKKKGACRNIEKSGGVSEGHNTGGLLYPEERPKGACRNIENPGGVTEDHDTGFHLYSGERPNSTFRVGVDYPKVRSKRGGTGGEAPNEGARKNIKNENINGKNIPNSLEKKMMKPRNATQQQYVNYLNLHDKKIIFAIGPAGTGKTMFATQYAMKHFLLGNYDKIIFTRPTVSVDEDIGFLPGSIEEKLSPWLRPIFDILYEFITVKEVQTFLEEKVFEMAPIGYLRGRTFKRAFIIADEMQNCTKNQMKMLLTRLGENSRMIITGDLEQHDRTGETNGLADFLSKLRKKRSESIELIEFERNDILREPIIKEVLEIYSL